MKFYLKRFLVTGLLMSTLVGCGTSESNVQKSNTVNFEINDYRSIVQANNEFAFQLFKGIKENEHYNSFISPPSVHMALGMTYNGSDGKTKDEMEKLLGIEALTIEEFNRANASLLYQLNNNTKATLNLANSIWLNEKLSFKEHFRTDLQGYFQAEVSQVNFNDEKAIKEINNWVKVKTNKKIEKIIKGHINPNTVAYLINAIYFKGTWESKFDKQHTSEDVFYLNGGETKGHPFMFQKGKYDYFENETVESIRLPYQNDEMGMYILLPKKGVDLGQLKNQLDLKLWNQWQDKLQQKKVRLYLPKFKIEYEDELKDNLIALGMNDAFDPDTADFSNMAVGNNIVINKVLHKSFIEVNEEGAEAAAVTAVEVVDTAAHPEDNFEMKVNRPFIFMIEDYRTGLILFMGIVGDPQVKR